MPVFLKIFVILLLIVIIAGEIRKPRIPHNITGEAIFYEEPGSPECIVKEAEIQRDFWSVILPFVPETAVVYIPGFSLYEFPNLRITAHSRSGFRILDTRLLEMLLRKVRAHEYICNEFAGAFSTGNEIAGLAAVMRDYIYGYSVFRIRIPDPILTGMDANGDLIRNSLCVMGEFHFKRKNR